MAITGTVSYVMVGSILADERITVSEDACLGGKTYAELDREDPLRQTAMIGSFLRASLFTSVVAFGVSALVVGLGALFILTGFGLRSLTSRKEEGVEDTAPPAATA